MRIFFWILFTICLATLVAAYFLIPQRGIPQFGVWGEIDGWDVETGPFLLVLGGGLLFIGGIMMLTDFLMKIAPGYSFNVPNAEYWRKEENLPKLREISRRYVWELGVYVVAFYFIMLLEIIRLSRLKNPEPGMQIYIVTGVSIFALVIMVVRMFSSFRIPNNSSES